MEINTITKMLTIYKRSIGNNMYVKYNDLTEEYVISAYSRKLDEPFVKTILNKKGIKIREEYSELEDMPEYYGQGVDSKTVSFWPNGKIDTERYYSNNDKISRKGKPAITKHDINGVLMSHVYMVDDIRHREDGPAVVMYRPSGQIYKEEYFRHGARYRADGPAEIDYYENGVASKEVYYSELKGDKPTRRIGRQDGPAEIFYYDDGSVENQFFYKKGKIITQPDLNKEKEIPWYAKDMARGNPWVDEMPGPDDDIWS